MCTAFDGINVIDHAYSFLCIQLSWLAFNPPNPPRGAFSSVLGLDINVYPLFCVFSFYIVFSISHLLCSFILCWALSLHFFQTIIYYRSFQTNPFLEGPMYSHSIYV